MGFLCEFFRSLWTNGGISGYVHGISATFVSAWAYHDYNPCRATTTVTEKGRRKVGLDERLRKLKGENRREFPFGLLRSSKQGTGFLGE